MLDINTLLVISFANILSHSVGCLFVLSMIFFAVQKLLSLIKSDLFLFLFTLHLRDGLKNHIAIICVKVSCLFYPLGGLWLFGLTLMSYT